MDLISVDPIKLCKQPTGRLPGSWNFNDVVFICNIYLSVCFHGHWKAPSGGVVNNDVYYMACDYMACD